MKDIGLKRLTVDMPEEIFAKLKAIAALKNVTLRQLVNRWIAEKIKKDQELLGQEEGK